MILMIWDSLQGRLSTLCAVVETRGPGSSNLDLVSESILWLEDAPPPRSPSLRLLSSPFFPFLLPLLPFFLFFLSLPFFLNSPAGSIFCRNVYPDRLFITGPGRDVGRVGTWAGYKNV